MFLKDKASFNVDWLDGYHAANEANSIPVIGSDGKLPIAIIPTGKGSTQVALGNHTHTATEVGARPNNWIPSKADIEGVLTGNISSHTHNPPVNITGNSATADKLKTPRKIGITGGVTGTGTDFDGSSNINIPVTQIDLSYTKEYGILGKKTIIDTHPEGGGALIPFINNDLAFLTRRGGSYTVTKNGTAFSFDLYNTFDGTPSYSQATIAITDTIIIEINCHRTFTWSTMLGISFGAGSWRAKDIKFQVMKDGVDTEWVDKITVTNYGAGILARTISHKEGTGFNKIRITLSNFNSTNFRIAGIFAINYHSYGLSETFISRGGSSSIFGSLSPHANNTYTLGENGKQWNEVRGKILIENGTSLVDKYLTKSSSSNIEIIADSDKNSTSEYLELKAGNNSLKVMSSASATGADKLLFNGSKVYHEGFKPVIDTIKVSDSRNVNSGPQTDLATPIVKFDFRSNTATGLSDGGSYSGVMGFRPYGSIGDWSGGPAFQLAFTNNNNLWLRKGTSDSWNSWKKVIFSDEVDTSNTVNKIVKRDASGNINVNGVNVGNTIRDTRITTGNTQVINAASSIVYVGNPATSLNLESSTNPTIKLGSTVYTIYHTGNKPTPADIGAATSSHTHTNIVSRGKITCETGVSGRPAVTGLSMSEAYNNGYPTTYGNVINLRGQGDGQILVGWSGSDGAHAPVYVRSKRDNTNTANWSGWAQFYTTAHKPTAVDVGARPSSWVPSKADIEGQLTGTITTHTHNIDTLKGAYSSGVPVTSQSAGYVKFHYNILNNATGCFPTTDNANGILQLSRHNGGYDSQLGFSSNGNLYYRSFSGNHPDTTTAWKQIAFTDSVMPNAESWKVARKELDANTNLDNLGQSGHYISGSDGNSQTIVNRPPGNQGFALEVRVIWMNGSNPGRITQVAYMRNTNEIYMRNKDETTGWSSWKNVSANTWRPVVDNLTSTATDQSLSANQGKVLKGLIDGKSDSSHNHDSRYFRTDAANSNDVRLSSGDGRGLRFWDSDSYKIYMSSSGNSTWGGRMAGDTTSDYNIYFKISGNTNRGFVFKGTSGNIMGVDGNGDLRVKGSASIGDNKVKMQYNATTESLDFIFV